MSPPVMASTMALVRRHFSADIPQMMDRVVHALAGERVDRECRSVAAESGPVPLVGTRAVKAFNTTGSGNMVNPEYGVQKPVMPVAGDDEAAKAVAIGLADEIGFAGFDAGPLAGARDLEHLAMP